MARKPIRITLFTHKGGVGKTTLTLNIASALAEMGYVVLVVDADPQCNLTSSLINDEVVDDLLDRSDSPNGRTLWSAIKPIVEGNGDFVEIPPFETAVENLFLYPGDIRLSEFEQVLTDLWAEAAQRRIRGFRGTTVLSRFLTATTKLSNVDFIFYDQGPNTGPLNRSVVLDCDYFIVPAACDLFSTRALKTLGFVIADWIRSWNMISDFAPDETYLLPGKPHFLGYIPQNFRVYGGAVAKSQAAYLSQIEKQVYSDIITVLRQVDSKLAPGTIAQARLGEVKHLGSLVQDAQRQGVPIWRIADASNPNLLAEVKQTFEGIAQKIVAKTKQGK
jgi:cellulose biosynthesis protein BcsQ